MINNERIPDTPPEILPVPDDVIRPLWSVMIPIYNCMLFVEETINSVLQQYPGKEKMQIEVIDDCSTDGDVAALIERIGNGAVQYYRKEKNMGSVRNFETCIQRAKGYYVHILHGDDYVLDGFYNEIESLFNLYPEAGAAFTEFDVVDEKRNFLRTEPKLQETAGLVDDGIGAFAVRLRVQPPAIVVKRSVYEKIGGFYAIANGEDWHMWLRVAANSPLLYSPKRLACYRRRENNLTANAFTTGQFAIDVAKVINLNAKFLPPERRKELTRKAKRNTSIYEALVSHEIYHNNNNKAALNMARNALKLSLNVTTLYLVSKLFVKTLVGYKS